MDKSTLLEANNVVKEYINFLKILLLKNSEDEKIKNLVNSLEILTNYTIENEYNDTYNNPNDKLLEIQGSIASIVKAVTNIFNVCNIGLNDITNNISNNNQQYDSKIYDYLINQDLKNISIHPRTIIILSNAGYNTIKDFIGCSKDDLLSIKNFGEHGLKSIIDLLKIYSIELNDEGVFQIV